jgi:hypothetical protein
LDVEHAERVEVELDAMISRRDLQRRELEGERRERELWAVSAAKYNARRQRELAQAWLQYHIARQRAHRRTFAILDAHHAAEIRRYTAILANERSRNATQ